MWKTHAAFHIWRCRPFQMHFQFSLRLPKLELPECPRTKKTQTRGGTCVSVLGPPVPEQAVWVSIARERGNPWAKRCVGPCWQRQPGKRSVCRSGLVPAAPTDPSRSTEVSWPGPHWEGCSRSWNFVSSFSCFFSPGLVKFARYRMA